VKSWIPETRVSSPVAPLGVYIYRKDPPRINKSGNARKHQTSYFLTQWIPFYAFLLFLSPPTYPTPSEWHLLVNLGCWIFQISRLTIIDLVCCKRFSKNMLVRYRVINNKGVLERPWTKWMVLIAISSTLKLQFTIKC